jgi:WD40 repeat protein
VSGAPSDLGNPVVPRGLAWSPDGTRLALEAADGSLWLIDPEGTNAVELAPPASEEIPGFGTVSWSPDGAYLACVRDGGVALVDLATGVVRALDPTLDLEPTSIWWSSSPVPS